MPSTSGDLKNDYPNIQLKTRIGHCIIHRQQDVVTFGRKG
jgi:hypothetical protein